MNGNDALDEQLVSDEGPNVDVLMEEFKLAGVLPNGGYDLGYNEETRRMIWAGQSPDGRRWDENMPEGQPALPWNGSSDTRYPLVDGVCNDEVTMLKTAFRRAEVRASAIDPDKAELAAGVTGYLHWMVNTKYKRLLRLETELSAQFSREHGFCVAYVGWEREIGKRRVTVTMEDLQEVSGGGGSESGTSAGGSPMNAQEEPAGGDALAQTSPGGAATEGRWSLSALVMDPTREEEAVASVQGMFGQYVKATLASNGRSGETDLFEEEVARHGTLSKTAARKAVKELRELGTTKVAVPYVCKNQALVRVLKPYQEFLAARGTMMLQEARALFWRRWMTEGELESKQAEGWDPAWIEEVKKTKGNISSWASAIGSGQSSTGPSMKVVGGSTYLRVNEESNPLIEVVYGYVRKVDEDGVTGIYETIFSPHVSKNPLGGDTSSFCGKHELLDYAHGRYPFVELKRENLGRALTDSRSVPEVAGTWQNEVKKQRDMLFNRADWDTLPPVQVPKLGGVDYRLGPGAQVPLNKAQEIKGITLGAAAPSLALELVQLIGVQKDEYFGQPNAAVDPGKTAAKQMNAADDFYMFWGEVLLHMFALTLQFNRAEVDRMSGSPETAALQAESVLEQFDIGLEFDVRELHPDFLEKKLKAVNEQVLPGDVAGVIDRTAYTTLQLRMLDPRLAQKVVQEKGAASQKMYDEVELNVMRMAQGNEARYVENDPTAKMKMQFLQTIVEGNPNYQAWLQKDKRFGALMQNYAKNLQMSVDQQENKTIGRIGVRPLSAVNG